VSTPTEEGIQVGDERSVPAALEEQPRRGRALDASELAAMEAVQQRGASSVIDVEINAAIERLLDGGIKVAEFAVVVQTAEGGVNVTSSHGVMGAIGMLARGDALARKIMLMQK